MLTPSNVQGYFPGITIKDKGSYRGDQWSKHRPIDTITEPALPLPLDYYMVDGKKHLTFQSISYLALGLGIKIEDIDYEFKDAEPNGYIIVEAVALDRLGNNATGCAVEPQGPHCLSTAFSKAQRQAISQCIPMSDIKQAQGDKVNGYQPPKVIDHYSRAFAAKMALDKKYNVNHKKFWKWVSRQAPGTAIDRITRPINNWTKLKKHPRLCCRIAALLVYYKSDSSTIPF